MTIIEAVAKLIEPRAWKAKDTRDTYVYIGKRKASEVASRTAILAVLNHLKDNVTPEMKLAADLSDTEWAGETFRAMIDEAIKEIG